MPTAPAVTPVAPTNAVTPTVTGSPTVGVVLASNAGSWNGTPTPFETQLWQRSADGSTGWASISPQPNPKDFYTLAAADLTGYVSIFVTSTNTAGVATLRSNVIGPVVDSVSPPGPVSPPVITTP